MRFLKLIPCLFLSAAAVAAEWTFPNGGDPKLSVPHRDELAFPDGFKATLRFSVDLAKIGKTNYANLFCKGSNFEGGYCVMMKKSGCLLIDIKGIYPSYYHPETQFTSNREYLLELYVTKTAVRVFVDGREDGSYAYAKAFDFSTKAPLAIGSFGGYPLTGSIRSLKLEPLSAITVPAGGPVSVAAEPPRKQTRAEILWSRPICIEKDRYIGWPTVKRLKNGDLVAVFSGDRDSHVCPWGKVQLVRSRDGGETWSEPVTIQNGPIDDRDAGLVEMPDGDLVLTWFTSDFYRTSFHKNETYKRDNPIYWWKRHDEKLSDEVVRAARGYFRAISKDGGKTWTKPMRMEGVGNAPHGPRLLPDGSLLQLGIAPKERLVSGKKKRCTRVCVCRSTDKGATWTSLCDDVPWTGDEGEGAMLLDEPDVIAADDGTIVGMVRFNADKDHFADHYLRTTLSHDGGHTWSPTVKTPVIGYPPHLLKLAGGKLVCVYGRRKANPGYGEFAVISDDNGRTWDVKNEIVLRRHGDGDLGYPSSCQLPDGSIVTVYYQPVELGEKPCLMATKWRVTR